MAHFIKSDIDDKRVDELFEKIDDIDLDEYQEKLTAGDNITIDEDNVISADLSDYQEKLTAGTGITISDSNVISSTASGGTQLYLHHITSTQVSSFEFYFITNVAVYENLSLNITTNDFVKLFNANIRKSVNSVDINYTSLFNSFKIAAIYPEGSIISSQRFVGCSNSFFLNGEFYATIYSYDTSFATVSSLDSVHVPVSSLVDTVTAL